MSAAVSNKANITVNDTNNSDKPNGMHMTGKAMIKSGNDNRKHGDDLADVAARARARREEIEDVVRKAPEADERDPQVHRLAYKGAESPLRERHARRRGEDIIDYAVRLQRTAHRHYAHRNRSCRRQ